MIKKLLRPLLLFLSILSLSSCKLILGIKDEKYLEDKEIVKYAKKFDVPGPVFYKIDTVSYMKAVKETNQRAPKLAQHVMQPLQMRIFNRTGLSTLSLVNCDVGGIFKLDWNRLHSFDKFPPNMKDIGKPDTTFNLKVELEKIIPIHSLQSAINTDADVIIIIYWTRLTTRYSKDLIKLMNNYKVKFKDESLRIVFVNTDNLFVN